jgi:hypothetical protein
MRARPTSRSARARTIPASFADVIMNYPISMATIEPYFDKVWTHPLQLIPLLILQPIGA